PVMGHFYNLGWEIFLFRNPDDPFDRELSIPPVFRDRVIDLGAANLSFRQSAAVLATCDVLLAPDSSLMHVAGALGLPCVALFGPTAWQMRTAYYPSVHAIQGHEGCTIAPCWYHGPAAWSFPRGQPCFESGRCEVISSIAPDRVIQKIEQTYSATKAGRP
ncbi:MAG: glycosyltransferase family 9 protein, partial [Phycisphaerales bacterium]|nr:glycosyltransferase family 9 protein [Phycisphaerales bacterium]